MLDPFLASLPAPSVVEPLSIEAIFAEMKAELSARFPNIAPVLALESSATVKALQTCAYREYLLRVRVNDAARANLLAFATGSDLDHVGANASPPVQRMYGEDDERFRSRILLSAQARNVGSPLRFKLIAMGTDILIKDAIAYRSADNPRDPTVYVALLSTDANGIASPALISAVEAEFDKPENRMVNSDVVVVSAVTSVVNVVATIVLTSGTPPSIALTAEQALRSAWAAEGGLGRDLTRDWIRSRLMLPGIYSVNISAPSQDAIKPSFEAVSIGTVSLTVTGESN